VRARAAWLSRLFKLEFMFEPGVPRVALFEETIGFLERIGALAIDGERIRPGAERDHLEFLAQFLRPFLEAYRLAAETVAEHLGDATRQPLDRKALVKLCLEHGRAGLQAGRISTREAVSKATLENAVEWLVSTHHLVERKGKLARRDGAAPLVDIIDPITRHLAS
jgi:glycerol-3-phosphate O-acyltransferase